MNAGWSLGLKSMNLCYMPTGCMLYDIMKISDMSRSRFEIGKRPLLIIQTPIQLGNRREKTSEAAVTVPL